MKYKIFKYFNMILLFIGIYIIYQIGANMGWEKILEKILSIKGWQGAAILALPISWNILHAVAWYFLLENKRSFNFRMLLRAQIASSGVSEVIPLGQAGGESYRLYFLKKKYENKHSSNSSNITASIILYNTIHTLATVLFMASAFIILIIMIKVSFHNKLLAMILLISVFILLFLFMKKQKQGFMMGIFVFLNRFKIFQSFVQKKMDKAKMVDTRLNQFYSANKKNFYFSCFLLYLSKFIGVFEIYMILSFIGDPITFPLAAFIFAGKSISQILLFFFPAQIGATESSLYYIFNMLSLLPVSGLTTALFIRIRTIAWTFLGLLTAFLFGPKFYKSRANHS